MARRASISLGIALSAVLAASAVGSAAGVPVSSVTPSSSVANAEAPAAEKPSNRRRLTLVKTITGGLSPKSIVASQTGKFFAQNMMYQHTITVFNRNYVRVKTISDRINLAKFGYDQYPKPVRGAPVEAARSPDGKHMYVSNYTMYGPGFDHQGFDRCTPSVRIDRSFIYRINTKTLRKTAAYRVGRVPKYLEVSPDGRYLLVGNWCSWDISVVDLKKGKEIKRIKAGVAPRGIAFSHNGKKAYVTLVGENALLVIDMAELRVVKRKNNIGVRPRHLVMGLDGRYLYITVQGLDKAGRLDGRILKYDRRKHKVVARSPLMVEPRTTVMAPDGKSLYVVDYHPGRIVKIRTSDMKKLQSKHLGYHPIGVTYDNATNKVWVSGYGGHIWVLKDR